MSEPSCTGGFEKLAHLVDEEDEPAVRSGLFGGRVGQCGDQVGFGPAAARLTGYKPHPLHRFSDDSDGILAPRNDGKDAPSPRAGRQCIPDRFRQLLAEDSSRFPLQSRVAVQQGTKGDDQARFTAAVRAGPRVCALSGFANMSGHCQKNVCGGLRADETFEAGGVADVGVIRIDLRKRRAMRTRSRKAISGLLPGKRVVIASNPEQGGSMVDFDIAHDLFQAGGFGPPQDAVRDVVEGGETVGDIVLVEKEYAPRPAGRVSDGLERQCGGIGVARPEVHKCTGEDTLAEGRLRPADETKSVLLANSLDKAQLGQRRLKRVVVARPA